MAARSALRDRPHLARSRPVSQPVVGWWLGLPAVAGHHAGLRRAAQGAGAAAAGRVRRGRVRRRRRSDLRQFMTADQIVTFALVNAIYIPCVATIAMLARELGWRNAALISPGTVAIALLVGGVVDHALVLSVVRRGSDGGRPAARHRRGCPGIVSPARRRLFVYRPSRPTILGLPTASRGVVACCSGSSWTPWRAGHATLSAVRRSACSKQPAWHARAGLAARRRQRPQPLAGRGRPRAVHPARPRWRRSATATPSS